MSSVIFVSSIASLESFFLSNNSPGYVTIVNFFGAILIFLFAIPMINSFGLMGLPVIILFSRFLVWITYLISFMKHAKISISEVIFLRFSDIKIFLKLFKGNH